MSARMGIAALVLSCGLAATASAQTTGTTMTSTGTSTTIRPGRMQAPSQPFLNYFPSPAKLLNIITFNTPTPTNSTPASYLQQFGYQVARPAQ